MTYFPFPSERILNIHGHFIPVDRRSSVSSSQQDALFPPQSSSGSKLSVRQYVESRGQYESSDITESTVELKILDNAFPRVDFEQCFVVTDRNTFSVELSEKPETIFMNFAKQSMWSSCKYFCDIFNVSMGQCIEFVGDELLRQKKVTQALMTYNVAQIAPIKMALKLATYGESNALLNLSAMALKCIYVLKSTRPVGQHMKELLKDSPLRHLPQKGPGEVKKKLPKEEDLNKGFLCSDFCYSKDEASVDVQMSFSSQFHLANLMLLTLSERTIADKNYFPIWNFIQLNQKFHTNLASTILAQSGLYSTTILLAKVRGAGLDVFLSLTKAMQHEHGKCLKYKVVFRFSYINAYYIVLILYLMRNELICGNELKRSKLIQPSNDYLNSEFLVSSLFSRSRYKLPRLQPVGHFIPRMHHVLESGFNRVLPGHHFVLSPLQYPRSGSYHNAVKSL